jgi:hypothetical protein
MRRPLDFSIRSLQHPLDQLLDLGRWSGRGW